MKAKGFRQPIFLALLVALCSTPSYSELGIAIFWDLERDYRHISLLDLLDADVLWVSTTTKTALAVVSESDEGLLREVIRQQELLTVAMTRIMWTCEGPAKCSKTDIRIHVLVESSEADALRAFVEGIGGVLDYEVSGPVIGQGYLVRADGLPSIEARPGVMEVSLRGIGGGPPTPIPAQEKLELGEENRFSIKASVKIDGEVIFAQPRRLTADSGVFWFFRPDNLELTMKILDACRIDGYFWLFVTGLTNLEVEIEVFDRETSSRATYTNAEGSFFEPIRDFRSLPCS